MSEENDRGFQVSNQIVFWILGVLGTFTLTIGGVMVTSVIAINTNMAEVRTELRLTRQTNDTRLATLEADVKELRENQAAVLGRLRTKSVEP